MARGRRITAGLAALALIALAAGGCVRAPTGAERYSATAGNAGQGAGQAAGGAAGTQVAQAGSGSHVVVAGDTLYGISRRSGVPLRSIIEANGLQPPYELRTGQLLVIPQVRTHTVQPGETLYGISRGYGVELSALARQNGLDEPFTIKPGQVLVLPHQGQLASAAPLPATQPQPQVPETAQPQPTQPAAGGVVATPLPPPAGAPAPQPGLPQPVTPQPAAPPVAEPAPQPTPQPAPQPVGGSAGPAVLPDPPARAGSKFIWPVDGTVISGYGPKAGGLHNDGINIAAPKGSPVKAAENGVVAYVGSELKGFGNLVLIKHQGDYVTAYAHNDQILVKRGDIVRRGETIARVGSTGSVDTPQLHFEIRKGSRAVEPTAEMTQQTAGN